MNKIGVLYFCEDELKKEFIETKKNFQSKSTKSKYLNHPAHISIYVFEPKIDNYSNLIDDFKMMEKIIINLPYFHPSCKQTLLFFH